LHYMQSHGKNTLMISKVGLFTTQKALIYCSYVCTNTAKKTKNIRKPGTGV